MARVVFVAESSEGMRSRGHEERCGVSGGGVPLSPSPENFLDFGS